MKRWAEEDKGGQTRQAYTNTGSTAAVWEVLHHRCKGFLLLTAFCLSGAPESSGHRQSRACSDPENNRSYNHLPTGYFTLWVYQNSSVAVNRCVKPLESSGDSEEQLTSRQLSGAGATQTTAPAAERKLLTAVCAVSRPTSVTSW